MEIFVLHILKLNILASMIILLVKILAVLLKGRVSARWKYFIWLLIAVSLLVPVRFSADISMFDLQVKKYSSEAPQSIFYSTDNRDHAAVAGMKKSENTQNKKFFGQKSYTVYESGKRTKTAAEIFLAIWLLAAAWKLTGEFLAYYFSVKKLERMSLPVNDPVSVRMYREVCEDKRIRRKPQLRQNAGITTPLLAGLFHTKLYLPSVGYSAEERKLIFCHELTHYRHKDLWYKFLLRICASIYWFNPFLLLMMKEADRDIENLCDAVVIRGSSKKDHQLYRQLLLRTAAAENRIPYVTVGLNDSGMVFKDRILYMMNIRKLRRGILPGVLLSVLLAGGNLAFSVSAGTENMGTEQRGVSGEKTPGSGNEDSTGGPAFSDGTKEVKKVPEIPDTETGTPENSVHAAVFEDKKEASNEKTQAEETVEQTSAANADSVQAEESSETANNFEDAGNGSTGEESDPADYGDEELPENVPYTSGFNNASGVASIVAPGEGDTESRVLQDNGNGVYSDENGYTYRYQGDGNWSDSDGNSYRTWNDEDYNSGTYLEHHELQGSNGSVNVKEMTNGEYYYRDAEGVGYTDNGDGTWTDEYGNVYTE